MNIDNQVKQYINNLISYYPLIDSIWLLGSRANNSYNDDSDWDLLVFANKDILEDLRRNNYFKEKGIDVLIVFDGENFEGPWPDNKGIKRGDLTSWNWDNVSDKEATYRSVKYINEDEWFKSGNIERKTLKAIRIWPN